MLSLSRQKLTVFWRRQTGLEFLVLEDYPPVSNSIYKHLRPNLFRQHQYLQLTGAGHNVILVVYSSYIGFYSDGFPRAELDLRRRRFTLTLPLGLVNRAGLHHLVASGLMKFVSWTWRKS